MSAELGKDGNTSNRLEL